MQSSNSVEFHVFRWKVRYKLQHLSEGDVYDYTCTTSWGYYLRAATIKTAAINQQITAHTHTPTYMHPHTHTHTHTHPNTHTTSMYKAHKKLYFTLGLTHSMLKFPHYSKMKWEVSVTADMHVCTQKPCWLIESKLHQNTKSITSTCNIAGMQGRNVIEGKYQRNT